MLDQKKSLVERLEAQPELRARIEAILAIAENEAIGLEQRMRLSRVR